MKRINQKPKIKNEKFAELFDQIWPEISEYFLEELGEKIRIKARGNILKSAVKNYGSKQAKTIMLMVINDAIFITCFNKALIEKNTKKRI